MANLKRMPIKPLLHWHVLSRIGVALGLSLLLWLLVFGVSASS
ncbi:MAG TPA: hypothetical protein VIC26_07000 [Marinagarivorans sp.]